MTNISKTFKEVAEEFIGKMKEGDNDIDESAVALVAGFASYLDSFRTFDANMEILARTKSQEIDREVLHALFNALSAAQSGEYAQAVVRGVLEKHSHKPIHDATIIKNDFDILQPHSGTEGAGEVEGNGN